MDWYVDHVSVGVPDFRHATETFSESLGLEVTVSPQAPDRHGRIHLDRAYLEVATLRGATTWNITHVFLGFSDLDGVRTHLDGAGFPYRYSLYEGVDGTWDDIELEATGVPLPGLVRRTRPAHLRREWPPPLRRAHRCGATTIVAVHIPVPSISTAVGTYGRLLGRGAASAVPQPGLSRRHAVITLGRSRIVLVEGTTQPAVVLGVVSLERTRAVLGPALAQTPPDGIAWADPSTTCGLAIGFTDREPVSRRS